MKHSRTSNKEYGEKKHSDPGRNNMACTGQPSSKFDTMLEKVSVCYLILKIPSFIF
jgi:hypothetical protein